MVIKLKPGTHSSKSEYFLDDDGVLYKRRSDHKRQLVVPKSLVEDIIKANHDPVYVAHPGTKRTVDLISLSYWWPSMRKSVEDYIRKCGSCQRRKEEREFVAPLGKTEEPSSPFEVTSMDITGPYLVTPRKNKKSHLKNKRLYDRKAKLRSFQTGDIVYLYNPAKKPGKCFKFHKYWTGPFQITAKLSDLNYEITSMNNKTQVVHVNRLKIAYNPETWKPKQKTGKSKNPN